MRNAAELSAWLDGDDGCGPLPPLAGVTSTSIHPGRLLAGVVADGLGDGQQVGPDPVRAAVTVGRSVADLDAHPEVTRGGAVERGVLVTLPVVEKSPWAVPNGAGSANVCAAVDWPDGQTHHQYPSNHIPPLVPSNPTPASNGPP
jgi:hypothetical protein